jgi:hypothetical protein
MLFVERRAKHVALKFVRHQCRHGGIECGAAAEVGTPAEQTAA